MGIGGLQRPGIGRPGAQQHRVTCVARWSLRIARQAHRSFAEKNAGASRPARGIERVYRCPSKAGSVLRRDDFRLKASASMLSPAAMRDRAMAAGRASTPEGAFYKRDGSAVAHRLRRQDCGESPVGGSRPRFRPRLCSSNAAHQTHEARQIPRAGWCVR